MKKILLAIVVMMSVISAGHCETQPLQLIIKADNPVYEVGEKINIEALIKNLRNKEVKIYSPAYWGVSEINVLNSHGVAMEPRGLKVERESFENFWVIPLNQSRVYIFENLRWFHCGGAWEFVGEAQLPVDTYRISVTITNPPVDKCNDWNKNFEITDLLGTIASNTITIEVLNKKASKEGEQCSSNHDCANISCTKYDTPSKDNHKPSCENNKCKCMCYECQ